MKHLKLLAVMLGLTFQAFSQAELMLIDFEGSFDVAGVRKNDAQASLTTGTTGQALEVTLGHQGTWSELRIDAAAWDLSAWKGVSMDITNLGSSAIQLIGEVSVDGRYPPNKSFIGVNPGETQTMFIVFYRNQLPGYIGNYLTNMKGLPGGYLTHWELPNLTQINTVKIVKEGGDEDAHFLVDNIRATGEYKLPTESELNSGFFPFVDIFGQYSHIDWPGKTGSLSDILAQHQEEVTDLAAHPGPSNWNQYGGWTGGPQLQATGHFRVQRHDGKWWLVDPEGRLFWSQGIDCVGLGQNTPTNGRENYFAEIPDNGDFRQANLRRKFGEDWNTWRPAAVGMIHTRLRSWGVNTIANWSSGTVYEERKTPYIVTLSSGMPKEVPEQLNEATFRTTVQERINAESVAGFKDDPWCLGAFVDNELSWPANNAGPVAETYFRVVKEVFKAVAPDVLYLGSRIHTGPDAVYTASAAHCDVVSINRYDFTIFYTDLPEGSLDKPMIIGEFHFGALDRGLLHTGLRSVINQEQRARAYTYYFHQALEHERIVGAHWFQYCDQVVTGRGDGENYQIGFVDIVDRPYPEMVAASRKLGEYFYDYRLTGTVGVEKKRAPHVPHDGVEADHTAVYDLTGRQIRNFNGMHQEPGVYLMKGEIQIIKKVVLQD